MAALQGGISLDGDLVDLFAEGLSSDSGRPSNASRMRNSMVSLSWKAISTRPEADGATAISDPVRTENPRPLGASTAASTVCDPRL